jgi:transcription elongation factor GreA
MVERLPMTKEAYDKLDDRLRWLKYEKRPEVEEALGTAREHGDLSENSEYDAAREELWRVDGEIAELEDKRARAEILDTAKMDKEGIHLSATVTLLNLDDKDEEILEIVNDPDGSFEQISVSSPLAEGLLGHKVGDKVEVEVPAGTLRYEVLKIEYPS